MKDVAVFLYDLTGKMAAPWLDAGFTCYIVDLQHKRGTNPDPDNPRLIRVGTDLRNGWLPPAEIAGRVAFCAAFPPCDHLAVSGARWFKGKGLRMLALSVDLFATAAEVCEWFGAPYLIENPVSAISTYWRKPDHTFHPWHYTALEENDNYKKLTCLWTGGGFVMPIPQRDESLGEPDDRIHKCPPSADRANIRSATPAGFASAVFRANQPRHLPKDSRP